MCSISSQNHGSLLFALGTLLSILASTQAQGTGSCQNYGVPSPDNSSACLCPPGFGSADCSLPGCGGTIFQGLQRPLAQPQSSSSPFANLTASNCNCEDGWTGTGCNVCTTANACQSALQSVGGGSGGSSAGLGGTDVGLNETLVCSASPRVWAAGQMSCQVNVSLSFFSSFSVLCTWESCSYERTHFSILMRCGPICGRTLQFSHTNLTTRYVNPLEPNSPSNLPRPNNPQHPAHSAT
jgi:hypothetical protein